MVSVETVTVPTLLPRDERTLVEIGVGFCVGIVTTTGVGEMHSSMQNPGQEPLTASEQLLAGSSPTSVSQSTLSSFVQSTVMNSNVGIGVVGSGFGFCVGLGVG